ncbi:MAG TPA: hypothetical protein PKW55_00915 [Spirochaetota bacterium]|nr:hypothetical protein [Spirochaetota bacterium]HOM39207.1 hypothetical protein [Spirochaetota bacterium]HPQ49242.1 hypothetical protein [Spirochaetota bacterium]
MAIEEIVVVASKMYGISRFKSKEIIDDILKSNRNLKDCEILKLIGDRVLFLGV